MGDEPVAYRIRRGPAVLGALYFLVLVLVGVKFVLDPSESARLSPEAMRVLGAVCVPLGIYHFLKFAWLAHARPVGLRLDREGMSGYFFRQPLAWSDLAALGRGRANRFGRVKLRPKDRVAERYSANAWWRITDREQTRWPIVIPGFLIGLTRNEMVALLRQWHLRHVDQSADAE